MLNNDNINFNINNIVISSVNFKTFFALKKGKKVLKSLSIYVLSEDAKLKSIWAPGLTPLIGKEKITDFCNVFNKESALFYNNDVFIPVFFLLYKNKTYSFIFKTPTLFTIFKYLMDVDRIFRDQQHIKVYYYLTLEELYVILCIKYNSYLDFLQKSCLVNIIKLFINFKVKIIL